ncbi:hypothetical protein HMSSN139_25490 [Paenibacillus sp. HMSSN-139]|nr:hypothetical protein HMSSN139_25490 [Paenibacillus sp. HMSSN-139]
MEINVLRIRVATGAAILYGGLSPAAYRRNQTLFDISKIITKILGGFKFGQNPNDNRLSL